ncbi:Hypothetical predicted protein [Octopus vulgaris]|uniref:Uncharacterized protein n=1 Tax=Octopus vulgaris TaxID=6645 RepID=A0AA36BR55_OCTVU|nr:Hypothetical predicted protein [Octopus vulgaris]
MRKSVLSKAICRTQQQQQHNSNNTTATTVDVSKLSEVKLALMEIRKRKNFEELGHKLFSDMSNENGDASARQEAADKKDKALTVTAFDRHILRQRQAVIESMAITKKDS